MAFPRTPPRTPPSIHLSASLTRLHVSHVLSPRPATAAAASERARELVAAAADALAERRLARALVLGAWVRGVADCVAVAVEVAPRRRVREADGVARRDARLARRRHVGRRRGRAVPGETRAREAHRMGGFARRHAGGGAHRRFRWVRRVPRCAGGRVRWGADTCRRAPRLLPRHALMRAVACADASASARNNNTRRRRRAREEAKEAARGRRTRAARRRRSTPSRARARGACSSGSPPGTNKCENTTQHDKIRRNTRHILRRRARNRLGRRSARRRTIRGRSPENDAPGAKRRRSRNLADAPKRNRSRYGETHRDPVRQVGVAVVVHGKRPRRHVDVRAAISAVDAHVLHALGDPRRARRADRRLEVVGDDLSAERRAPTTRARPRGTGGRDGGCWTSF